MQHLLTPEVPVLNTTNRSMIDRAALQAFKDRHRTLEARPEADAGQIFDPERHRLPGMREQNLTPTEYATMHRQIDRTISARLKHDDRPATRLLHLAAQTYLSIGLNSDYGGDMSTAMTQAIHDLNSMYVAGVQAAAKRLLGSLFDRANDLVEEAQTRVRAEVMAEVQADLERQLAEQAEAHRLALAEQAEAHLLILNEQATVIRQLKQEHAQLKAALSEAQTQVASLEGQLQQSPTTSSDQWEVQVLRDRIIVLERERQARSEPTEHASPTPVPTPLALPIEQVVTADSLQQAFALKLWLDAQGLTCTRSGLTLSFHSTESGPATAARFAAEVPDPRLYARQALTGDAGLGARSA